MPLVKSGRIVEDQYVRIADDAPIPDGVAVIVSGARFLADASVRLKTYLEQTHPADKLLSPDFNDHYNADGTIRRHPAGDSYVQRYVMHFANAGGQFGSAVAWHPYGAVRRKSMASTDDLVATLNATAAATLPIWVTEVGASASAGEVESPGHAYFQTTDRGLARHIAPSYRALAGMRRRYGIERVYWYTWASPYQARAGVFGYAGLNEFDGFRVKPMPALSAYRRLARAYEGCRKDARARCVR